jgi:hypothetical protein
LPGIATKSSFSIRYGTFENNKNRINSLNGGLPVIMKHDNLSHGRKIIFDVSQTNAEVSCMMIVAWKIEKLYK